MGKDFGTAMGSIMSYESQRCPEPACEFQVGVSFLWIEAYPGLAESIVILLETNT